MDDERDLTEVFPDTTANILYNGSATWTIPARLVSTCRAEMGHYPFDKQQCQLLFLSWSYDSTELNATLVRDHGRIEDYIPNGQWDITDIKARREIIIYEESPKPWAKIIYTFVLQRRTMFYVFYLIIPTVLFIIIGVMVFILPPQSDEKVSLAVTLLLAMLVFLLLVFENIPRTDEIPFLGKQHSVLVWFVMIYPVSMVTIIQFVQLKSVLTEESRANTF